MVRLCGDRSGGGLALNHLEFGFVFMRATNEFNAPTEKRAIAAARGHVSISFGSWRRQQVDQGFELIWLGQKRYSACKVETAETDMPGRDDDPRPGRKSTNPRNQPETVH
jgi:hypothetical protein